MRRPADDGLDPAAPVSCWRYNLNGFTVVAAAGEIDLDTAPVFRSELTEAIASGSPQLIIDLSEVSFMDSTGLGVLVGAQRRAREEGGAIQLIAPNSEVRKVLTITYLDRVFPIHDTLADLTGEA